MVWHGFNSENILELRQRRPRVRDNKFLKFIRSKTCCVCGAIPVDAAHIRSGSLEHSKPPTGMSHKPDDQWCLPLCRKHHAEQHSMNELAFYAAYEINPFRLAKQLYYQGVIAGHSKPTTEKPAPKGKIRTRGFQKSTRKIPSRKFGS